MLCKRLVLRRAVMASACTTSLCQWCLVSVTQLSWARRILDDILLKQIRCWGRWFDCQCLCSCSIVASVAVVNVSVWLLVTFSYFGPPLELRTWSSSTMRGKRWRLARRRESKSFATVTSISLQIVLPRALPRSIFHDSVMSQFQDKLGRPRYLTCSSCKLLIY